MTATTVKSRGKRLERSVQSRVDHTKIRINSAAEARNHAQFARDMPQPRHSGHKKLDRRTKWRQPENDGVLLGECRITLIYLEKTMSFLGFNKKVSLSFERLLGFFPDRSSILESLQLKGDVADIGGGKQPYLSQRPAHITYTGIDIDADELALAPSGIYTQTIVADITKPPLDLNFDVIICRFTLEHVTDTDAALRGLCSMMKPDAVCYISAPSRYAIFSKINKILPEKFKRWLLFKLYPAKQTDGFKAYYDKMSPSEVSELIKARGGIVEHIHLVKFSGYFTFFFPLHLVWRLVSFVQMIFIHDYCERFEIVFRRPE